ncbi:unnamed protein product [Phytophthora fragariaefolia]|uniref:Unnamed protein product n=1 Tax=Phytophthora fragariaefolia TaxID=1490495 RepID=A0A9W6Y000_9STRA|nr:unnamed protein product [Phytophthora fragariaefolia]
MADSNEVLGVRTAAMQLDSAPPPSRPANLEILLPKHFEHGDDEGHGTNDAEMSTANLRHGRRNGEIAAVPALPEPLMYSGRSLQAGVTLCTNTRRMIARWEFSGALPETITEEQWKDYFRQTLMPTFVDYSSIDTAMKSLKMQTKWSQPGLMHLQADMVAIPNRFNITDLAFKLKSFVAQGVVDTIKARGTPDFLADVPAHTLSPLGGKDFVVQRAVTFSEVVLSTSTGPLMLRTLACLVEDGNMSLDFAIGWPIMTVLIYSAVELLARARDTKSEWDLGDTEQAGAGVKTMALQRMCRMQTRVRDIALDTMALEELVNNTSPAD